jgi:hypothetical protein
VPVTNSGASAENTTTARRVACAIAVISSCPAAGRKARRRPCHARAAGRRRTRLLQATRAVWPTRTSPLARPFDLSTVRVEQAVREVMLSQQVWQEVVGVRPDMISRLGEEGRSGRGSGEDTATGASGLRPDAVA